MKEVASVGVNVKLDNKQILFLCLGLLGAIAIGAIIAGVVVNAITKP